MKFNDKKDLEPRRKHPAFSKTVPSSVVRRWILCSRLWKTLEYILPKEVAAAKILDGFQGVSW